jgi:hypothetical protein
MYTGHETETLLRSYTDERLLENYAAAARHPGTIWHDLLLAEVTRRGLAPPRAVTE